MGWSIFGKDKEETADAAPTGARAQANLSQAIARLDSEGVRLALRLGANPEGSGEVSISPLVEVVSHQQGWLGFQQKKQEEIIQALLSAGARPSWGGRDGQSPFEIVIRRGWLGAFLLMLAAGQDPNQIMRGSPTPLHLVLSISDYKGWALVPFVKALLDAGADPASTPKHLAPALETAMSHQAIWTAPDLQEALILLVENGAVNGENGDRLAAVAIEQGWGDLAEAIATSLETR